MREIAKSYLLHEAECYLLPRENLNCYISQTITLWSRLCTQLRSSHIHSIHHEVHFLIHQSAILNFGYLATLFENAVWSSRGRANWDLGKIGNCSYLLPLSHRWCTRLSRPWCNINCHGVCMQSRCYGNYSVLAASRLPLEFGCSLCSKPHEMNSPCMFRSSQLFAGTSLTLFFRIFAASIIDSAVSILYKILFNANNFNPHKRPILCWIWPPAPRVCSEHGGQEQALKLSLNPIDIELSAMVSPSHG